MRYLLALLILLLTTADVYGWTLSLAPGLSVKNAIIYLIMLALAARFVVRGGMRMELPKVYLSFGVLIAYATLTWLVAGLLLQYKSYTLLRSGIDLKANLFDYAIIFTLYLYGTRTLGDAKFLLKCVLLAVTAANAISIGSVAGLFHIGVTTVGLEGNLAGRVFGPFGHANETAALTLCLLPAYVAMALSSGAIGRLCWALAGVISGTLMIMCGSRGAFVGLALAATFGSYICRGIISWRRAVILAVILVAVAVPVLAFVSIKFGDILTARVLEMFHDPGTSSDERVYIWRPVLDKMMANPIALITGFGWAAYEVAGFHYATHNYYLLLWFELGIIGLTSYVMVIGQLVITARRAAENATDETARHLIAFIYGIVAVSGSLLFAELYKPWLYIWVYSGLMMRMALIAMRRVPPKANEHLGAPATGRLVAVPHRAENAVALDSTQQPNVVRFGTPSSGLLNPRNRDSQPRDRDKYHMPPDDCRAAVREPRHGESTRQTVYFPVTMRRPSRRTASDKLTLCSGGRIMTRRLLISGLLAVGAFIHSHAAVAATVASPPFPRLGGYLIGHPNYGDATYQANIAKLNMVILTTWPDFVATDGHTTMPQVVSALKALNPNLNITLYTDINELSQPPSSAWNTLNGQLAAQKWWLYPSGTAGTPVASSYGTGYWEINTTTFTAPNSSGQNYLTYRAQFDAANLFVSGADGIYIDNVFWAPRVNGDWNRDGTTDSTGNATVQQWYRLGYVSYIHNLASAIPGKYIIGNVADWGQTNATLTEYQGVLTGGVMEGMIGASWSYEGISWATMMAAYVKMMAAIASPQLVIFAQEGSTTDYQGMRYGLASCLMGNAYFYFSAGESYSGVNWFDEFDAALGTATSSPFPTAAWQNGVYRRDFQNGIALVNPKGNGTRTVTLETSYKHLSGQQAPTINNGQTVTTVTLNDRDGVILLRTTSQVVPDAPSLSVQ